MGPTVEVMSHGEAGGHTEFGKQHAEFSEHPGAGALQAVAGSSLSGHVTACPMLVQSLGGLTLGGLTTTRSTFRCT